MKRVIAVLLALCLCLSLAACGNDESSDSGNGDSGTTTSPYATKEPEWSIDVQMVSGIVGDYISSEGYNAIVEEFESIFGREAQPLYVNWAMEYKLDDIDGQAVHYILIDVSGDVMDRGGSAMNRFTLLYDMGDGCTYSSVEADVAGWLMNWNGVCGGAEDARFMYFMMSGREPGDIFWTEWEIYKPLTDSELEEVNSSLGLKPYEAWYGEDENGEPVVKPAVIDTAPETRVMMVIDAVKEFIISGHYDLVALENTELRVVAAMEYKLDDLYGQPMHVILVRLDGVNYNEYSGADFLVMDVNEARVLCQADIDYSAWEDMDCVEDLYAICALSYLNILTDGTDSMISPELEAMVHLTEDEINAVNQEIRG